VCERKEWLFSHLERCLQDVFGLDRVVQDLEGDDPFLTDGLRTGPGSVTHATSRCDWRWDMARIRHRRRLQPAAPHRRDAGLKA
jgi:hypothetical protein